jgi:intracellular multiplication protein IcmC
MSMPNFTDAIYNFSLAFDSLEKLIGGVAYVMGLGMVIKGVIDLKNSHIGAQAGHSKAGASIFNIAIGSVLLYLPSSMSAGLVSVFGNDSISSAGSLFAYSSITSGSAKWSSLLNVLQKYIQLIGYIAFIRGFILIAKEGRSPGQQHAGYAKPVTHIIAGVLLVNIVSTLNILASTFGFS